MEKTQNQKIITNSIKKLQERLQKNYKNLCEDDETKKNYANNRNRNISG